MIYKASQAYSFGTKDRNFEFIDKKVQSPGPAMYQSEANWINKTHNPKYSFSKDIREKGCNNPTPGPGEYEGAVNTFGSSSLKFSLNKSQRKDIFLETCGSSFGTHSIPGPGQYELNEANNKQKGFSLNKTTKEIKYDNNLPGPGAYELDNSATKKKVLNGRSANKKETPQRR